MKSNGLKVVGLDSDLSYEIVLGFFVGVKFLLSVLVLLLSGILFIIADSSFGSEGSESTFVKLGEPAYGFVNIVSPAVKGKVREDQN